MRDGVQVADFLLVPCSRYAALHVLQLEYKRTSYPAPSCWSSLASDILTQEPLVSFSSGTGKKTCTASWTSAKGKGNGAPREEEGCVHCSSCMRNAGLGMYLCTPPRTSVCDSYYIGGYPCTTTSTSYRHATYRIATA